MPFIYPESITCLFSGWLVDSIPASSTSLYIAAASVMYLQNQKAGQCGELPWKGNDKEITDRQFTFIFICNMFLVTIMGTAAAKSAISKHCAICGAATNPCSFYKWGENIHFNGNDCAEYYSWKSGIIRPFAHEGKIPLLCH